MYVDTEQNRATKKLNCWELLKPVHNIAILLIRGKCEGSESRKNILDGARLNPKHYDNRQSAAKPEKESSTTIPREGSTIQAIGIGSGFA